MDKGKQRKRPELGEKKGDWLMLRTRGTVSQPGSQPCPNGSKRVPTGCTEKMIDI